MKTGIELIAIERQEQIEKHGRSIEYDQANNTNAELSFAAALLTCPRPFTHGCQEENDYGCPKGWDKELWFKMITKSYFDRLIIAGALIAAEIDRIAQTS